MKNNAKAFTLVELIVVITILAILGTIAFVSIQNYTVYARDAVRTSDLGSISRAITIKIAQGGYAPKPNNPVNITSSGTTVMFQGEFTKKMGAQYGVNGDLVDPLDGKNYTYSTDANLFKHELAGFLESDELTFDNQTHQKLALTQKAQALEGRTIFTKGDKLGIIFNSEETPIQELSLSGSTLDILNTTDTYKVYFDNSETLQGTGSTLSVVNPRASCKRILEMGLVRKGDKADGVYKISPAGEEFEVYCDMTTDGGGWILVMQFKSGINSSVFGYNSVYWDNNDDIGETPFDISKNIDYRKKWDIITGDNIKFCLQNGTRKCINKTYSGSLESFSQIDTGEQIGYTIDSTITESNAISWIQGLGFNNERGQIYCDGHDTRGYTFVRIGVNKNNSASEGCNNSNDFAWGFGLKSTWGGVRDIGAGSISSVYPSYATVSHVGYQGYIFIR